MSPGLARWLGSALGWGLIPFAPGTWGSFGTLLAFVACFGVAAWGEVLPGFAGLLPAEGRDPPLLMGSVLAVTVLVFWAGRALGNHASRDWGRKDPGGFVVDEVVGQLLALLPLLGSDLPLLPTLAAFGLFRLFDIAKPWPCRQLERLAGGVGIMADDVAAGLYAMALVIPLVP